MRGYTSIYLIAQRAKNARNLIPKLCAVMECAKINTVFYLHPYDYFFTLCFVDVFLKESGIYLSKFLHFSFYAKKK